MKTAELTADQQPSDVPRPSHDDVASVDDDTVSNDNSYSKASREIVTEGLLLFGDRPELSEIECPNHTELTNRVQDDNVAVEQPVFPDNSTVFSDDSYTEVSRKILDDRPELFLIEWLEHTELISHVEDHNLAIEQQPVRLDNNVVSVDHSHSRVSREIVTEGLVMSDDGPQLSLIESLDHMEELLSRVGNQNLAVEQPLSSDNNAASNDDSYSQGGGETFTEETTTSYDAPDLSLIECSKHTDIINSVQDQSLAVKQLIGPDNNTVSNDDIGGKTTVSDDATELSLELICPAEDQKLAVECPLDLDNNTVSTDVSRKTFTEVMVLSDNGSESSPIESPELINHAKGHQNLATECPLGPTASSTSDHGSASGGVTRVIPVTAVSTTLDRSIVTSTTTREQTDTRSKDPGDGDDGAEYRRQQETSDSDDLMVIVNLRITSDRCDGGSGAVASETREAFSRMIVRPCDVLPHRRQHSSSASSDDFCSTENRQFYLVQEKKTNVVLNGEDLMMATPTEADDWRALEVSVRDTRRDDTTAAESERIKRFLAERSATRTTSTVVRKHVIVTRTETTIGDGGDDHDVNKRTSRDVRSRETNDGGDTTTTTGKNYDRWETSNGIGGTTTTEYYDTQETSDDVGDTTAAEYDYGRRTKNGGVTTTVEYYDRWETGDVGDTTTAAEYDDRWKTKWTKEIRQGSNSETEDIGGGGSSSCGTTDVEESGTTTSTGYMSSVSETYDVRTTDSFSSSRLEEETETVTDVMDIIDTTLVVSDEDEDIMEEPTETSENYLDRIAQDNGDREFIVEPTKNITICDEFSDKDIRKMAAETDDSIKRDKTEVEPHVVNFRSLVELEETDMRCEVTAETEPIDVFSISPPTSESECVDSAARTCVVPSYTQVRSDEGTNLEDAKLSDMSEIETCVVAPDVLVSEVRTPGTDVVISKSVSVLEDKGVHARDDEVGVAGAPSVINEYTESFKAIVADVEIGFDMDNESDETVRKPSQDSTKHYERKVVKTTIKEDVSSTTISMHKSVERMDILSSGVQTDQIDCVSLSTAETQTMDEPVKNAGEVITADADMLTTVDVSVVKTQTLPYKDSISTAEAQTSTVSPYLVNTETETEAYRNDTLMDAETSTTPVDTAAVETQTLLPYYKEDISTSETQTPTLPDDLVMTDLRTEKSKTTVDVVMVDTGTSATPVPPTVVVETQTSLNSTATVESQTFTTEPPELVDRQTETDRTLTTDAQTGGTTSIDHQVEETTQILLPYEKDLPTADMESSTVFVKLISADTQTVENKVNTLMIEAETSTTSVSTVMVETQTLDNIATTEAETTTVLVDLMSTDTQTSEYKTDVEMIEAESQASMADVVDAVTETENYKDQNGIAEAATSTTPIDTKAAETQTLAFMEDILTADMETSTISVDFSSTDTQTIENKVDTLSTEAQTYTTDVSAVVAETQTLSENKNNITTAEAHTFTVSADLVSTDTQTAKYQSDVVMTEAETNTSPVCTVAMKTQTLLDRNSISTADTETWTDSVDFVNTGTETDKTMLVDSETCTMANDTAVVETQTFPYKEDISTADVATSTVFVDLSSVNTQTIEDKTNTLLIEAETNTTSVLTDVAETQTSQERRDSISTAEAQTSTVLVFQVSTDSQTLESKVGVVMVPAETCTAPVSTSVIETQTSPMNQESVSTAETQTFTAEPDLTDVETETDSTNVSEAETNTVAIDITAVETQTLSYKENISMANAETSTVSVNLSFIDTQTIEHETNTSLVEAGTSITSLLINTVETQTSPEQQDSISTAEAQTSTVPVDQVSADTQTLESKVGVVMVAAETCTTPMSTSLVETQTTPMNEESVSTAETQTFTAEPDLTDVETETDRTVMVESETSTVDVDTAVVETQTLPYKEHITTADVETSTVTADFSSVDTQRIEDKFDTLMIEAETSTTPVLTQAVETQISLDMDKVSTAEAETSTVLADFVSTDTQTADYGIDILTVMAENNTSPVSTVTVETQTLLDRNSISTADTETWTDAVDLVNTETETNTLVMVDSETCTVAADTIVAETQTLPYKEEVSTTDMETSTMSIELVSSDTQTLEHKADTLMTEAATNTTLTSTVMVETQTLLDMDSILMDEFRRTSAAKADLVDMETETDQTLVADAEICTVPEATATTETQTQLYEETISTADRETSTDAGDFISVDTQTTVDMVAVAAETSTADDVSMVMAETQTSLKEDNITTVETQTSADRTDLVEAETETDKTLVAEAETCTIPEATVTMETQTLPYKDGILTADIETSTVFVDFISVDTQTTINVMMVDSEASTTPVYTNVAETQTLADKDKVSTAETQTVKVEATNLVEAETETDKTLVAEAETCTVPEATVMMETQTLPYKDDISTADIETSTVFDDFISVDTQTTTDVMMVDSEASTTPVSTNVAETQTLVDKDNVSTAETQTVNVEPDLVGVETETQEYKDERLMSDAETSTTSIDTAAVETQTLLPYYKENVLTSEAQTSTAPEDFMMTDFRAEEFKATVDMVMVNADTNTTFVPPKVVAGTQTAFNSVAPSDTSTSTSVSCVDLVSSDTQMTEGYQDDLPAVQTQTVEPRGNTVEAETCTTHVDFAAIETQTSLNENGIDTATTEVQTNTTSVDLVMAYTQTDWVNVDVNNFPHKTTYDTATSTDSVVTQISLEEEGIETLTTEAETNTTPVNHVAVLTQTDWDDIDDNNFFQKTMPDTATSTDSGETQILLKEKDIETPITEAETNTTPVEHVMVYTQTDWADVYNLSQLGTLFVDPTIVHGFQYKTECDVDVGDNFDNAQLVPHSDSKVDEDVFSADDNKQRSESSDSDYADALSDDDENLLYLLREHDLCPFESFADDGIEHNGATPPEMDQGDMSSLYPPGSVFEYADAVSDEENLLYLLRERDMYSAECFADDSTKDSGAAPQAMKGMDAEDFLSLYPPDTVRPGSMEQQQPVGPPDTAGLGDVCESAFPDSASQEEQQHDVRIGMNLLLQVDAVLCWWWWVHVLASVQFFSFGCFFFATALRAVLRTISHRVSAEKNCASDLVNYWPILIIFSTSHFE